MLHMRVLTRIRPAKAQELPPVQSALAFAHGRSSCRPNRVRPGSIAPSQKFTTAQNTRISFLNVLQANHFPQFTHSTGFLKPDLICNDRPSPQGRPSTVS